jgi:hypothetical protein
VYKKELWAASRNAINATACVGFVCTLIVMLLLIWQRKLTVLQFAFLAGCLGSSFAMVILTTAGSDAAYCDGVYLSNLSTVCVLQGYMSIFFFLFLSTTTACQALDVYLRAVIGFKSRKLQQLDKAYLFMMFAVPISVLLRTLIEDLMKHGAHDMENVGFNEHFPNPFCWFRSDAQKIFNKSFIPPLLATLLTCAVLVLLTFAKSMKFIRTTVQISEQGITSSSHLYLSSVSTPSERRPCFLALRGQFLSHRMVDFRSIMRKIIRYNLHASMFVSLTCLYSN